MKKFLILFILFIFSCTSKKDCGDIAQKFIVDGIYYFALTAFGGDDLQRLDDPDQPGHRQPHLETRLASPHRAEKHAGFAPATGEGRCSVVRRHRVLCRSPGMPAPDEQWASFLRAEEDEATEPEESA